jgi:hypothetical protein
MNFNNKWTKGVNNRYRQMIKEGYPMIYIREKLDHLMKYHPEGKFNSGGGIFPFRKFWGILNEIKFNPNYIYFRFYEEESLWYKDKYDIICEFKINDIDYVLLLEYLVDNNDFFDNEVVYNIFFSTKKQYEMFIYNVKGLNNIKDKGDELDKFRDMVEKETNYGDIIKIFNAISYILLKIINRLDNPIYMISNTDNPKKINFYIKSIEDSFKDKYELFVGKSSLNNKQSYYFKIKK